MNDIATLAAASAIAKHSWTDRGRAPVGYVKGMAVSYAHILLKFKANDPLVMEMARPAGNSRTDALGLYSASFSPADLKGGLATLRCLFTLLYGLGMRESSGKYCEGRDTTAPNTTSETAEAGLFQMSWNARHFSPRLPELMRQWLTSTESGLIELFKEGVTCTATNMQNFGSGDGLSFQKLCKSKPQFAVEAAAISLRSIRSHWGPINRYEAEVRPELLTLFREIEAKVLASSPAQPVTTLAAKIVAAMNIKNYSLAVGPDVMNIVYVEGMDLDGRPNVNHPNAFDDQRILLRVEKDKPPQILGQWEATTEPGAYWTHNRMNPEGAFHIALGQQSCWAMGTYHDMDALVQVRDIRGTRDDNEDFRREGDKVDVGQFGVHHHGGYNYPHDDMDRSSAGCQVGRLVAGHQDFINMLKTDARYKADHKFIFTSTVLSAAEVLNAVVAKKPIATPAPPVKESAPPAPAPAAPVIPPTVIVGTTTTIAGATSSWFDWPILPIMLGVFVVTLIAVILYRIRKK